MPVIETARLRLRAHRPEDLADCTAMWGDPEVTRHISGRTFSREEVWSRMLRYAGLWTWLGFGYWAVEEKASGRFVGDVGFADFKREIQPSLEGMPELGWVLAPWCHGRGYATEAAQGALGWSDARLGAARTVCIVAPEHRVSLRVAEKCGYREVQRTSYKGEPTVLLAREGRARA